MQRMPRRNKPHNNTEIKKGTAICWGFGHCLGTGQFDRPYKFHFICLLQGQIEHSSFKMERVKLFQSSNQSIVKASIPHRWSSPSKLNYSLNFNPISETPFHYPRANLYKFLIYANSGF